MSPDRLQLYIVPDRYAVLVVNDSNLEWVGELALIQQGNRRRAVSRQSDGGYQNRIGSEHENICVVPRPKPALLTCVQLRADGSAGAALANLH